LSEKPDNMGLVPYTFDPKYSVEEMNGVVQNKRYRILKGQSQIDNPQKLAT
jgi:hypothetical protein